MKSIIALIISGFLWSSCSNTLVVSSWKSDQTVSSNYKNIIVLGIINQKDRSLRVELENSMVKQLRSLGYHAISAMDKFGPNSFKKVNEDSIASELVNSGFDAVITTTLLDKSKEHSYNPGNISYQPLGIYYNRFGRYYTTIYDRVYMPGYYTTQTNFFLETNLYDLSTKELVYSVQGKSFDPSSASALSTDYSKAIVKDMKSKGILISQK